MGRKGIPDAIKISRGTFRPDRKAVSNVTGAKLEEAPEPPDVLGDIGQERWREITSLMLAMGLLESRYLHSIEMYCRACDQLAECEEDLAEQGKYIVAETGGTTMHPANRLAREAREEIRRYLIEFGFTPSSAKGVMASVSPVKAGVPNRKRDLA